MPYPSWYAEHTFVYGSKKTSGNSHTSLSCMQFKTCDVLCSRRTFFWWVVNFCHAYPTILWCSYEPKDTNYIFSYQEGTMHRKVAGFTYILFCYLQYIILYLIVTIFTLKVYMYVFRHNCSKINVICNFGVSDAFCIWYLDICDVLDFVRHGYNSYILVHATKHSLYN